MRAAAGLALVLTTVVLAGPAVVAPAAAAPVADVWTVTASPLTIIEGRTTSIALTVSEISGSQIGCVVVRIPAGFRVLGASSPSPWASQISQVGPPALVQFNVADDPQRLVPGKSVTFHISVIADSGPLGAWTVTSYQKFDTASRQNAPPVVPLQPFAIIPAATPKPAPTKTPSPTAAPGTPAPTPTPTAPASTSTASPSATLAASPEPSDGAPATPSSVATASPRPTAGRDVLAIGRGASRGTEGRDVEFGSFGPLDFAFDWLIPGFVVSVPGFLVMLIVVLQATVGTAWLPLVRRDLGEFGIRRRRPGGPRSGTKEAI